MGIRCLDVRGDSNLAIFQINGDFDTKDPKMMAYGNVIMHISARFEGQEFHHIQRDNKQVVDTLARLGARRERDPKTPSLSGFSSRPSSGRVSPIWTNKLRFPHPRWSYQRP